MIIEGIRVAPQLYADDCTTPTEGEAHTEEMLARIIEWSRKWKLIVKAEKSTVMKAKANARRHQQLTMEVRGMIFKQKHSIKLLGLQMEGSAAMGNKQAHQLMGQVAQRTTVLLKKLTSARSTTLGIFLRVFKELALSICAYSLPHARSADTPAGIIQKKRTGLLIEHLGLPENTPHPQLRAELGIGEIEVELAVLRLRTLHKIYTNEEDDLTRQMLAWRLHPNNPNSSKLHEASRLLKDIKMKQTVEAFLRCPYTRAKMDLDAAAEKENKDRWKKQTEGDSRAAMRRRKLKPAWGLEPALQAMDIRSVSLYLRLRHGTLQLKAEKNRCVACGAGEPTPDHVIWKCPSTASCRKTLRASILSVSPQAMEEVEKLEETNVDHATDYLLGSGAASLPITVWGKVQTRFVAHLPYLLKGHT